MNIKLWPFSNKLLTVTKNLAMGCFFFLLVAGSLKSNAQYVTIPDPAFRNYLEVNYPSCMSAGQLDTTCTQVTTATSLFVYGLNIADLTGVQYFDNLNLLYCDINQLVTLPKLPATLEHLSCTKNHITSFPPLPQLSGFYCSDNLLTSLPDLPSSLDSMTCDNNLLTTLPPLPAGLREISCSGNHLTTLPYLAPELYYVDAHNNQISLIVPFDSLVFGSLYLNISNNPVSCLPPLPDSIQLTFCNTFITCLPNLPANATLNNCDVIPGICPGGSNCLVKSISGYAFIDADNDCEFDSTEQPLFNRIIEINGGQFFLNTNEDGYYVLYNAPIGTYQLSQALPYPQLVEITCYGDSQSVNIINSTDSFSNVNFPNHITNQCVLNTVDIATSFQRYCSDDNFYVVSYCNHGTDTSYNTTIEIQFDPEIIPYSSTLPWSAVSGTTYTFNIGTLPPEQCGSFSIADSISCNVTVGQTACVKANIYPDSSCVPPNPLWDGANVTVEGFCNAANDTVVYVVRNASLDSMQHFSLVTIYEDDLLLKMDSIMLPQGDSIIYFIPATGKSYRLEAEQSPFHPGNSQPRSFQEMCGTQPYSLGYIVTNPQDDADDWVEIDCHTIVASFDPNEKTVQPSGVGSNHFITANDELDYIISFQNTGTDTAFLVKIIDTLDAAKLDVTTIQPGPASSPYTFTLDGPGVAKFTFNNIFLPDSNVNDAESHGFVKFKIRQKPGNTEGTVINNDARIYFDYNSPVITDNTFLTIELKEKIYSEVTEPVSYYPNYKVKAWPNPFDDAVNFEVTGTASSENYTLQLYDVMGEMIYQSSVTHSHLLTLKRNEIPAGIYFYKILNNHLTVAAGKLIAR